MTSALLEPPVRRAPEAAPVRTDIIGPRHAGMRMTGEEWEAHEDWDRDYRYELYDGVLVVCPAPGCAEASPNDELGYRLRGYIEANPDGPAKLTLPERYIRIDADNRRRCDRAVWCGEFPKKPDEVPPTLAIEIVSASARDRRRDYVTKRAEYLSAGVKEYWVIDRHARTVTKFEAAGETVYDEAAAVTSGRLPGFELPVAAMTRAADLFG